MKRPELLEPLVELLRSVDRNDDEVEHFPHLGGKILLGGGEKILRVSSKLLDKLENHKHSSLIKTQEDRHSRCIKTQKATYNLSLFPPSA